MKSGANYLVILDYDGDVSAIDKVIFTIKGLTTLTREYPTNVTYSEGKFVIALKQADTTALAGNDGSVILIEAQTNFSNKSVSKKLLDSFYISGTLATEMVTGDTPSGSVDVANIRFYTENGVIIAKVEGDVSPEEIEEAVESYMSEHPVSLTWGSITGNISSQTDLQSALNGKVNTVSGKGLSSNDYTDAEKTKVSQAITEHQSLKTINNQSIAGSGNITISEVPVFTASDNGKVLGVVNGALAWVSSVSPTPTVKTLSSISATKTTTTYSVGDTIATSDISVTATYSDATTSSVSGWTTNSSSIDMSTAGTKNLVVSYTEGGITKTTNISLTVQAIEPVVPQTGTWQLKTTEKKKYIILGTDDDNDGNASFFRLLRSYNFPYTMNVEAENLTKSLGNDLNDNFTESDAPSLFPNGVTVTQLGQYLKSSGKGEVAQHGASDSTLWDSANLTGSNWTTLYNSYTSQGGTKSESELKTAIATELADTNGSNDAPYVMRSRQLIENAMGFSVDTVGIWGGSPSCTVDGITLDLNVFKGTSNYNWRGHNFWAVGNRLGSVQPNTSPYDISRITDSPANDMAKLSSINYGNAVEFFWHWAFGDHDFSEYRTMFNQISADNTLEVVTRKQYADLGEYVSNPITNLSLVRSGSITVGGTDSDSDYTITVTYADSTTGAPLSDVILDRSNVDTNTAGSYTVYAYYRAHVATATVLVTAGASYPAELKERDTWFVYKDVEKNLLCCGNNSGGFTEANRTANGQLRFTCASSTSTISGWISEDDGATWTQVQTNRIAYAECSVNKSAEQNGGYAFQGHYNMTVNWIETSGNFTINI